MKRVFTLLAVLLLPMYAVATDPPPKPKVVPPAQSIVISDESGIVQAGDAARLGDLVEITTTAPDVMPAGIEAITYDWKVIDGGKEHKVKPSGRGVCEGAGVSPKRQQVFCVITYLVVDRQVPTDSKSPIVSVSTQTAFLYRELLIGQGSVPPSPPGPSPTPAPKPVVATNLWVCVVEETSARTVETADVLTDLNYWKTVVTRGHLWRFYDKDSDKGKGYAAKAADAKVSLPAVLVFDKNAKDGENPLTVVPLPKTTAGIDDLLTKFSGGGK